MRSRFSPASLRKDHRDALPSGSHSRSALRGLRRHRARLSARHTPISFFAKYGFDYRARQVLRREHFIAGYAGAIARRSWLSWHLRSRSIPRPLARSSARAEINKNMLYMPDHEAQRGRELSGRLHEESGLSGGVVECRIGVACRRGSEPVFDKLTPLWLGPSAPSERSRI